MSLHPDILRHLVILFVLIGKSLSLRDRNSCFAHNVNSVFEYSIKLTGEASKNKILDRFNIYFLGQAMQEKFYQDLKWNLLDNIHVGRQILFINNTLDLVLSQAYVLKFTRRIFNIVVVSSEIQEVPDIPKYRLRNEHHYYIFHQLMNYQDSLLNKVFKLKFKVEIQVPSDYPNSPLRLTSMCFFCSSGYPALVSVPPSEILEQVFEDYATNLNGTTLNVTATKGIHRAMDYEELENGTVVFAGGYVHRIFFSLKEKFGFKYKFTLSRGFGHKSPNGTFNGVIGALQSGKFDYAMEAGSNSDRYAVVEYLPLVAYETLSFLTRIPTHEPKIELVFEPFKLETWFALFCTMLLLAVVFGVLAVASSKLVGKSNVHIREHLQMGLEFTVTTILEQGYEGSLLDSGIQLLRMLATAWLLSLIVLGTAYKAKLTTLMAYPALEAVPSTFDELADSDYTVFLHELGGLPELVFKTATNPKLVQIRRRLKVQKSLHNCIEETVKIRAACVALGFNSMFMASKNFSNIDGKVMIRKAPHTLLSFMHAAPLMKKGQPFARHFAKTVHTLNAMGLTSKFILDEEDAQLRKGKRWAKERTQSEKWRLREPDGPQPIKLVEVLGVIIVYTVMVCICSIAFATEKMQYRLGGSLRRLSVASNDKALRKWRTRATWLSVFRVDCKSKPYKKEHDAGSITEETSISPRIPKVVVEESS